MCAFICFALLVFFGLFAAAAARFDMSPSAIYTHISFYDLSYNKKSTFFYCFHVCVIFFVSIFMKICVVFLPNLAFELNFVSTHRQRKRDRQHNIVYKDIFFN